MTVDPDSLSSALSRAAHPYSGPGTAVALPAPTNADDEWAEWQVGSFTVTSGSPVTLTVEIEEGMPTEITVRHPGALAAALLAAQRGEWPPPTGKDVTAS